MPERDDGTDSGATEHPRVPVGGRSRKTKPLPVEPDPPPKPSSRNRIIIGIAVGLGAILAAVLVVVVSRALTKNPPPVPPGFSRFESSSPPFRIDYPSSWIKHTAPSNNLVGFVSPDPSPAVVSVHWQKVGHSSDTNSYAFAGEGILRKQQVQSLQSAIRIVNGVPVIALRYIRPDGTHNRDTVFVSHGLGWRISLSGNQSAMSNALPTYAKIVKSFSEK